MTRRTEDLAVEIVAIWVPTLVHAVVVALAFGVAMFWVLQFGGRL